MSYIWYALLTTFIIILIFLIGFYIYVRINRWSTDRIGSLTAENIRFDININPNIDTSGNPLNFVVKYPSIIPKDVNVNSDKTVVTVQFEFRDQQDVITNPTYVFDLINRDTNICSIDNLRCIAL